MRIVRHVRGALALACCLTLSACSGCGACSDEPEVVDPLAMKAVDEPEPEPEVDPAPEPDEENEALRNALLGLNEPDAGPADVPDAEPEPEPEPEPRRKAEPRRSKSKEQQASAASGFTPPPPARGGLTDSQFNDAVGDWRGVRKCLRTEQVRGTDTRNGAVRVAFTVRPDGSVQEAQVVEASNAFARALAPCIERRAMRVQFPSFPGPEPYENSAKFVF